MKSIGSGGESLRAARRIMLFLVVSGGVVRWLADGEADGLILAAFAVVCLVVVKWVEGPPSEMRSEPPQRMRSGDACAHGADQSATPSGISEPDP